MPYVGKGMAFFFEGVGMGRGQKGVVLVDFLGKETTFTAAVNSVILELTRCLQASSSQIMQKKKQNKG